MLEKITELVQNMLKPGIPVLMFFIIMLFVWIIKLIKKDSITWYDGFRSALLLGVAFIAIGMVIGFTINIFARPFEQIQKYLNYNALDLGWAPMSGLSWAWPFAFLVFPIQFITNIVMLKLDKTKTLNADIWNVWIKVFLAFLVSTTLTPILGPLFAVFIGLFAAFIQVIFELKNSDVSYERQFLIHKIPNVNAGVHGMMLLGPTVDFVNRILLKFKFFQDDVKEIKGPKPLWVKTLGENMFAGFIVGAIISLSVIWIDKENWHQYLALPFNIAAALVLFPAVAKFFTQSLVPLGSAIQKITQEKFKGKEIYIGLDFPILAGDPKLWLIATMLIPTTLLFSIIFSFIPNFKAAFPLGGMINVCLAPPALVYCRRNMKRMFATGVILTPLFLFFASYISPVMTEQALANKAILSGVDAATLQKLGSELWITSTVMNTPDFHFAIIAGFQFLVGSINQKTIVGICWMVFYLLMWRRYVRLGKIDEAKLRQERLQKQT